MFPIQAIRNPLNAVAFPAMSKLQHQPVAFRMYYRRLCFLVAFLSMPLSAFLLVLSRPVIHLVLGSHWDGAVPVFSSLAFVAFVQPAITLWGIVSLSSGMSRRYLTLGVLNTAFSVSGMALGLPWGAVGVATGYAVATYLSAYPLLALAFRGTAVRMGDFALAATRPALASATSAAVCGTAFKYLLAGQADNLQVLIGLSVYAPLYPATLYWLPGGRLELERTVKTVQVLLRGRGSLQV